jgi:RNA polymerase sigma-70 factor (ECF subfamily)
LAKHGERDQHLSQMSTPWTQIIRARELSSAESEEARRALIAFYGSVIHRYLLAATRDQALADDLYQDFALQLVRGDFRRADPTIGRFRDYLRVTLARQVNRARQRARALPLQGSSEPATTDAEAFQSIWLEELMQRAWQALDELQRTSGKPLYIVLRFRADHPELSSSEIAARLSGPMGKPLTAQWVRKWTHLGRRAFADCMIRDVARSIAYPTRENLERELSDLGLLEHCREALDRFVFD